MRPAVRALVVATLLATITGCSNDSASDQQLTIFAAASLTSSFTTLEKVFEQDHDGVDVVISFGSSTALGEQIIQGAPADLIATADDASITAVADAGLTAGDPQPFATNTMVVVTPKDNPAGITSLTNLEGTDFVVCDVSAPCGKAAAGVLRKARIKTRPVSYEADVKAVLSKVILGEADAGIVYASDAVAAADDVMTIPVADDVNVINTYYIAAVKDADAEQLARDWLDLVVSQAGQLVFSAEGFGAA